mmetsp:Transcript_28582/g.40435  ORF Transcript_28582/g.40435 Transcript_28582/m.40435 type:complete len:202 (-) Transcript_28582:323-928(-)
MNNNIYNSKNAAHTTVSTATALLLLTSVLSSSFCSAFVPNHNHNHHSTFSTQSIIPSTPTSISTRQPRNTRHPLHNYDRQNAVLLKYQENDETESATNPTASSSSTNQYYYRYPPLSEEEKKRHELANAVLNASRNSFQNVEGNASQLLERQPLIALLIFIGVGLIVAYVSGFIFLGGYMSSPNPVENGAIPYWDEQLPIE